MLCHFQWYFSKKLLWCLWLQGSWATPGSCQPQMGPMLALWTLLSGVAAKAIRYKRSQYHKTITWGFAWNKQEPEVLWPSNLNNKNFVLVELCFLFWYGRQLCKQLIYYITSQSNDSQQFSVSHNYLYICQISAGHKLSCINQSSL